MNERINVRYAEEKLETSLKKIFTTALLILMFVACTWSYFTIIQPTEGTPLVFILRLLIMFTAIVYVLVAGLVLSEQVAKKITRRVFCGQ